MSQESIELMLKAYNRPITMREMSNHLNISVSAVVKNITRLRKRKEIITIRKDRRHVYYELPKNML